MLFSKPFALYESILYDIGVGHDAWVDMIGGEIVLPSERRGAMVGREKMKKNNTATLHTSSSRSVIMLLHFPKSVHVFEEKHVKRPG